MPLVYQQNINAVTKIGVWHIAEPENFFLKQVPVQREITHWHKRLQHLAGRLLLTELFPGFPVELIQVADTRKPFLADEPFHFSISHCGDYAAAIVSREYRVGVDVELVSKKIEQVQYKFLGEEEWVVGSGQWAVGSGQLAVGSGQLAVGSGQLAVGSGQWAVGSGQWATLGWCVKESVYKWWGSGAIDFKKDIVIKNIAGDAGQGIVQCCFKNETELNVHFLHFNDNYLTWVLTDR